MFYYLPAQRPCAGWERIKEREREQGDHHTLLFCDLMYYQAHIHVHCITTGDFLLFGTYLEFHKEIIMVPTPSETLTPKNNRTIERQEDYPISASNSDYLVVMIFLLFLDLLVPWVRVCDESVSEQ